MYASWESPLFSPCAALVVTSRVGAGSGLVALPGWVGKFLYTHNTLKLVGLPTVPVVTPVEPAPTSPSPNTHNTLELVGLPTVPSGHSR
jgi:hypothetical protein